MATRITWQRLIDGYRIYVGFNAVMVPKDDLADLIATLEHIQALEEAGGTLPVSGGRVPFSLLVEGEI